MFTRFISCVLIASLLFSSCSSSIERAQSSPLDELGPGDLGRTFAVTTTAGDVIRGKLISYQYRYLEIHESETQLVRQINRENIVEIERKDIAKQILAISVASAFVGVLLWVVISISASDETKPLPNGKL